MAHPPAPARNPVGARARRVARVATAGLAALAVSFPLLGASGAGATVKAAMVGPTIPKKTTAKTVAKASSTKSAAAKSSSSKTTAKKASVAKVSKPSGLGIGSKGAAVVALQTRLAELRYDITDTTGYFGDQTYHAVMAFQKANGLSRTGVAGSQTVAAMAEATDPEPMLPDGSPDRIEIDLKRQILMLYRGGELQKILSASSGSGKEFCVNDPETGKSECDKAVTPGGSFRVTRRWIGWRESKLGELYNPLYFNGGIAIHGAPSVPGYPASHGCVRIPMISAEWFPNEVVNGTAVYVFGGEKAPVPLGAKAPTDTQVPGASTIPRSTTTSTIPVARLLTTTTLPGSVTVVSPAPTTTGIVAPATTVATTLPVPVPVTSSTVPAATTSTVAGAPPSTP